MYKTELHCHSSEVSGCSSVDVNGVVEKYTRHGYTTVVLKNHLWSEDDFEAYTRRVNAVFDTCDKARAAAGDRLCVLDGVEFRLESFIFLILCNSCCRKVHILRMKGKCRVRVVWI